MNDALKPYAVRAVDGLLEEVADNLGEPDSHALQALLVITCGQLAHHIGAGQTKVLLGVISTALDGQLGRELGLKLGLDEAVLSEG